MITLVWVGVSCFFVGILFGKAIFGRERKKPRTGVLYMPQARYSYWDYYAKYETCSPIVIVEELGVAADQSKINILSIEGVKTDEVRRIVKKEVGNYWKTKDIVWDDDQPKQKNPFEEAINTPMSELVKKIEEERVEDF